MTLSVILAITFMALAVAALTLNHFFNFVKDPLIVIIVVAALLLLAICSTIYVLYLRHKLEKVLNKDLEAIYQGLVHFQNGTRPMVLVQTDNPYIKETVDMENKLVFGPKKLNPSFTYQSEEFLPFAKLVLEEEDPRIISFIYIENNDPKILEDAKNSLLEEFKNHERIYHGHSSTNAYAFIVVDMEKSEVEKRVLTESSKNPNVIYRVGHAPETSFDTFTKEVEDSIKINKNYGLLEGNQFHELAFNDLISYYLSRDLSDKSLLTSFLKDIMPYLPFSHIALQKGNKYIRQVNWSNTKKFSEYTKDELGFVHHEEILSSLGEKYVLTFATLDNIGYIYKDTKRKMLVVKATVAALISKGLEEEIDKTSEERYENLLHAIDGYSYSVSQSYEIVHTSKALQNKFKDKLIGQKCYKAFYHRDEPCALCPLKGQEKIRIMSTIGSGEIRNIAYSNKDIFDIYLIKKGTNIVSKKAKLQERLLDLINNDYRGYLLCFKLENLEDVARKGKIKEKEVIAELFNILSSYGLSENLYQKEDDEFVYILENTSSIEATEIAKRLALALDDKLTFAERGYLLSPKVILLSYPLEVSTLFDLDSLSRTLYKEVDKKGRLYRISSNPAPIDKRRYYIEIIEDSFKKDSIPVVLHDIKDRNNELSLKEIRLAYHDENENLIPEDDITLYAKQENIYGTLIERIIKELQVDETSSYVLPLYREGQSMQLLTLLSRAWEKKKVDYSRLIFMVKEQDIYMHLDFYEAARKLGFHFAYWTIENFAQDEKPLELDFIYASGPKARASKLYQLRITKLLNEGYTFRIDEDYLQYLKESRFLG